MKTKIKKTIKSEPNWKTFKKGREKTSGYANSSVEFVANWKVGDLVFKRDRDADRKGESYARESFIVLAVLTDKAQSSVGWNNELFTTEQQSNHGWNTSFYALRNSRCHYPTERSGSKYKCIVLRAVGNLSLPDEVLYINDTMGDKWDWRSNSVKNKWCTNASLSEDRLRATAFDKASEFFREQNEKVYSAFCDKARQIEQSIAETEVNDHHQLKSVVNKVRDLWSPFTTEHQNEGYIQTFMDLDTGRYAVFSHCIGTHLYQEGRRWVEIPEKARQICVPIENKDDLPVIENADWEHSLFIQLLRDEKPQRRLSNKRQFAWVVTGNFQTGTCAIGFGTDSREGWMSDIHNGRYMRRASGFWDEDNSVQFEHWISNNADRVARMKEEENHMTVDEQFERAMMRFGGGMN